MKRALLALAALLLVALGAAVAFVLYREHEARNVHGSSTIEFVTTEPVGMHRSASDGSIRHSSVKTLPMWPS